MSFWRWIGVILVCLAAPPIIARTARAIALREKRKRECQHLLGRVQALLREEFPGTPVESPTTPFSWFTEPELEMALVTPTLFALVIAGGQASKKDLDYVANYGGRIGSQALRIYVHAPNRALPEQVTVEDRTIEIRAVQGCSCGAGAT